MSAEDCQIISVNSSSQRDGGRQVAEIPVFQALHYAGRRLNDVITSGLPTIRPERATSGLSQGKR
jgi:hypothetical protein